MSLLVRSTLRRLAKATQDAAKPGEVAPRAGGAMTDEATTHNDNADG